MLSSVSENDIVVYIRLTLLPVIIINSGQNILIKSYLKIPKNERMQAEFCDMTLEIRKKHILTSFSTNSPPNLVHCGGVTVQVKTLCLTRLSSQRPEFRVVRTNRLQGKSWKSGSRIRSRPKSYTQKPLKSLPELKAAEGKTRNPAESHS